MARRKRDMYAGVFHVWAHSVWAAQRLFNDDVDRSVFLRELARATSKVEWTCCQFCLMKTHYHLLLVVEDTTLPRGMHALNFRYAAHFNGRHRMKGHVFGARYGCRRLETNDDLLTAYRYVANNPVKALLCRSAELWRWSSHAGTVGIGEPSTLVDAARILDCFEGTRELRMARLREYVSHLS
jgi:REP element-mobilizing transposase RayT